MADSCPIRELNDVREQIKALKRREAELREQVARLMPKPRRSEFSGQPITDWVLGDGVKARAMFAHKRHGHRLTIETAAHG